MNKYELRVKINRAQNEIGELHYNIQRLYDRRYEYEAEKRKAYSLISYTEDYYTKKQNRIRALEGVNGRANNTMLAKLTELFTYEGMKAIIDGYDYIADCIQNNIRIADDKIKEAEKRIRQLEINIYNWENEIRNTIMEGEK